MKWLKKYLTLGGLAGKPEDPYRVYSNTPELTDVKDKPKYKLQSACFVLRPSREKASWLGLKAFYEALELGDKRKKALKKWVEHGEIIWREDGNDARV